MPADDGRDIIILSDLHISTGRRESTGTFDRNEDFFYDGAFERFVGHLLSRAQTEGRQLRLVILGDFVDFLQVDPGEDSGYEIGDTSSASTLAKLEIIEGGHRTAFGALGRFVGEGHLLDVVLGNHDVEFVWPEVQARFREMISRHAGSEVDERVSFHRWIFYVPGVVYADHGHQYDSRNSFVNPLAPFLPPKNTKIELPLGSFFVLYLFNELEHNDPFADNIKPSTLYIRWALLNHPSQGVEALLLFRKFWRRVMEKTRDTGSPDEAAERREALRRYAGEIGLPPDAVGEIHEDLAKIPTVRERADQEEALLRALGLGGTPLNVALGALRLLGGGSSKHHTSPTQNGHLAPASFRGEPRSHEERPKNYLLATARKIHGILARSGKAVPAYVFGHTHNAEQASIDGGKARYFNSGTWTPLIPNRFDLLTTRELFTFVEIRREPAESEGVVPKLLLWNDLAGRTEPLTRLELSGELSKAARRRG